MHLAKGAIDFGRGPAAPLVIGDGDWSRGGMSGASLRRAVGLGAYCPSPRVWVTGYGCLDPANAAERGIEVQVTPQPMGPDTSVNLLDPSQPLTAEARAIIEAGGHTIRCQPMGGTVYCSIDGGEYNRQAMVVNRNPAGVLLELGHGVEVYSMQQNVRTLLRSPASAPAYAGAGANAGDQGTVTADVQDGPTPPASEAVANGSGGGGGLDSVVEGLSFAGLPGWAVLAAGGAALYFMTKGKG